MSAQSRPRLFRNDLMVLLFSLTALLVPSCTFYSNEMSSQSTPRKSFEQRYAQYDEQIDCGDRSLGEKQFALSEQCFRNAREIAEKEDWPDSKTVAWVGIARAMIWDKRYQYAETELKAAIEYCDSERRCSLDQIDGAIGSLMYLYVYSTKDVVKAVQLVEEIKKLEKADGGDASRLICKYANYLSDAGHSSQGNAILQKEDCHK